MGKLFLTTLSVLALATAGAGIGRAAGSATKSQSVTSFMAAHGVHAGQKGMSTRAINFSHRQIVRVQQHLKADNLYRGPIDGQMNARTRQAIAQFQKGHHLPPSGTVDLRTQAALESLTNGVGTTRLPGRPGSGTSGNGNTGAPNRAGR